MIDEEKEDSWLRKELKMIAPNKTTADLDKPINQEANTERLDEANKEDKTNLKRKDGLEPSSVNKKVKVES